MSVWRKSVLAVLISVVAGVVILGTFHYSRGPTMYLRGAVVKQDSDLMKQSPVTDVEVRTADGVPAMPTTTSFSGFFSVKLPRGVGQNRPVTLIFRHPGYEPLVLTARAGGKLSVVHLVPIGKTADVQANRPLTPISNILIRYSTVATSQQNIGTGAKTFEIPNTGNVPCGNGSPCSPDHKWKATVASESLDAGEGSTFRNAGVSCIAGPCPFTRIDSDGFTQGGRLIKVSVRNWSDTTTFLLQAEVFRPQIDDIVRTAYPVILGTSLNFTLPPAAEGPSIEAEVNGESIVFPLGPNAALSWADCSVNVDKKQAMTYRCSLKNDYKFSESK